jgi:hypothetical protein
VQVQTQTRTRPQHLTCLMGIACQVRSACLMRASCPSPSTCLMRARCPKPRCRQPGAHQAASAAACAATPEPHVSRRDRSATQEGWRVHPWRRVARPKPCLKPGPEHRPAAPVDQGSSSRACQGSAGQPSQGPVPLPAMPRSRSEHWWRVPGRSVPRRPREEPGRGLWLIPDLLRTPSPLGHSHGFSRCVIPKCRATSRAPYAILGQCRP